MVVSFQPHSISLSGREVFINTYEACLLEVVPAVGSLCRTGVLLVFAARTYNVLLSSQRPLVGARQ